MSIDFDGTNDAFSVDMSLYLPTAPFLHGYLNYDAAAGEKTIAYWVDSGDLTKFVKLTKSGNTLTITVQNGVLNQITKSTTIAVSTLYGFQMLGAATPSLRAWDASGVAGSWVSSSSSFGTPALPTNLDTCYFGYSGLTNYFNGRLAEFYFLPNFSPEGGGGQDTIANALGNKYSPLSLMPLTYDVLGTLGLYWPMYSASHTRDVFSSALMTAVDAPTSHASHPRIIYPRRGKRVIKAGATTRRVSLGGYYKSTGNRIVLVG